MTTATDPSPGSLLTAARQWYDAGFCVIPSHEDGSKRPFGRWKDYQEHRPTWEELTGWLSTGRYSGIGVICGAASGGAEMVEIEGPSDAAVERLGRVMRAASMCEMTEQMAVVARGCVEQSAGGGLHMFIRVADGVALPNTKLAMTGTGTGRHVVAETRGEGGFVIVAPTPGRNGHPEGSTYLFLQGSGPEGTPTITAKERDELHDLLAYALNEDEPERAASPAPAPSTPSGPVAVDSTFGEFRARTTWRDILDPLGWRIGHTDADGHTHWTRPGGSGFDGTSATTLEDGPMYVFSTSTDLPAERGMTKEYVYAHYMHGGDFSAASRALRESGFGSAPLPALAPWEVDLPEATDDDVEQTPYEAAVGRKYAELRIIEDARGMLAAHKAGSAPSLEGVDLATLLAQPDEEVRYRVTDLWPAEGRIMLAAAAKSGKTTMVAANLIPALVDGRPFLGRYATEPVAGKVLLLNMEVGDNTLRRWMRDCEIERQAAVVVANLRGKGSALSLASPQGRARFAEFLKRHEAEVVILDPLAPVLASLGLDENSNTDCSTFYSWWGEALGMAGIVDDVIVHHTGHAGQRSRGASRLLDEPDAIWTLSRETEDDGDGDFAAITPLRYLAAYGRDVELGAEALAFDVARRSLTLTGMGKAAVKGSKDAQTILGAFSDGRARTANAICSESGVQRNRAWDMVKQMVADGLLENVGKSPNGRPIYLPSALVEGA